MFRLLPRVLWAQVCRLYVEICSLLNEAVLNDLKQSCDSKDNVLLHL